MNYDYGEGPWTGEPDRVEWRSKEGGLPCLMRRTELGNWCGYVAVKNDHPLYGKGMDTLPSLEVHGGITYAEGCQGEVCHKPKPGESDDVWWLGFDCAHCFDLVPWMSAERNRRWPVDEESTSVFVSSPASPKKKIDSFFGEEYRDVDYVRGQCEELAAQLEQLKC